MVAAVYLLHLHGSIEVGVGAVYCVVLAGHWVLAAMFFALFVCCCACSQLKTAWTVRCVQVLLSDGVLHSLPWTCVPQLVRHSVACIKLIGVSQQRHSLACTYRFGVDFAAGAGDHRPAQVLAQVLSQDSCELVVEKGSAVELISLVVCCVNRAQFWVVRCGKVVSCIRGSRTRHFGRVLCGSMLLPASCRLVCTESVLVLEAQKGVWLVCSEGQLCELGRRQQNRVQHREV